VRTQARMFDLDAYVERIGLNGRPRLAELHRGHVASIPFENLDPHRGVPASLEVDDLQRKLVAERRGGYCFEHNMLLMAALQALGMKVEPMLARVRFGAPPATVRPRSHLVLHVRTGDASWLADVGFGAGTLLEPIPFGLGHTYEQSGWRFRLVAEGPQLVLQTVSDSEWVDVYAFLPTPVPQVDIETSNWFVSTHPSSPFVTGLLIGTQHSDGTRTLLSDWSELALSEQTPAGTTVTPLARGDIPRLLDTHFGLPGFALDEAGRVVVAGSC
jgi:N-hydroxyarylamine O-acetyltransferase